MSWGMCLAKAGVRSACLSFTTEALAAAASGLHWSRSKAAFHEALLWLRHRRAAVPWPLLLPLPRQPGGNKRACSANAPQVSFPPLSSWLAYSGLSRQWKQCDQQYNWHSQQDEQQCNDQRSITETVSIRLGWAPKQLYVNRKKRERKPIFCKKGSI